MQKSIPAPVGDAQRRSAAIRALHLPAALLDQTGRVLDANLALGQLMGQPQADLVGTILAPATEKGAGDAPSVPRPEAMPVQREWQFVRKDGPALAADLVMVPVGADAVLALAIPRGGPNGADSAEVLKFKEMAEFRARFLNIAAHELGTPLTPIRIQLQILKTLLADAPENIIGSVAVLTRSVDRLNGLMDDVLDAARAQASRLQVRLQPVSLSALLQEALESYLSVAHEMGLTLQPAVKADVAVMGDRARLMQVFNNLLSNGVKFTPQGGRLDVRLFTDGDWAVVHIGDTGRGMTREQLTRLFQPFGQVHEDLQGTKKGTGLGLYITKSIIDQHGGRIEVASRGPGAGTTVSVRLPLTDKPPAPIVAEPARVRPQLRDRLRDMV